MMTKYDDHDDRDEEKILKVSELVRAGTEPVAAGFVERIIFEKINHMMVKIVMMMMMMIMSGMHCMAAQLSW